MYSNRSCPSVLCRLYFWGNWFIYKKWIFLEWKLYSTYYYVHYWYRCFVVCALSGLCTLNDNKYLFPSDAILQQPHLNASLNKRIGQRIWLTLNLYFPKVASFFDSHTVALFIYFVHKHIGNVYHVCTYPLHRSYPQCQLCPMCITTSRLL